MAEWHSSTKLLLWALVAVLLSQTLVNNVACSRNLGSLEDDKAYSPRPHKSSSKGKPSCPTPSHGKGGGYSSPPGGGGGGYTSPPSGGSGSGTTTPPSGGGSGTYTPPSGGGGTPPVTIDPGTPYIPGIPMPPSTWLPSPGLPPFFTGTCDYWRTHPQAIFAICGYWNTIGRMLGLTPPATPNLSLLDALKNTRSDGLGDLYREGTAAFLNSLVNQKFAFSTSQVRDAFANALVSDQAAATQAQVFKRANEGRLK
ncbi:unnamed protein product [Spirodela intermedia]|uniref:Uncharacterized protein n=1 Tax=Spirodela intermedia TaxID=51605 RepID=A0A7I8KXA8_SPIIN|nr:unnamed protein product [Spirodela intermedia]